MENPLSSVVAKFYMEEFERIALDAALFKPATWFRYTDDTFVIWQHGMDELQNFLKHLNSILPNIQFIMEVEKQGTLPYSWTCWSRNERPET